MQCFVDDSFSMTNLMLYLKLGAKVNSALLHLTDETVAVLLYIPTKRYFPEYSLLRTPWVCLISFPSYMNAPFLFELQPPLETRQDIEQFDEGHMLLILVKLEWQTRLWKIKRLVFILTLCLNAREMDR